MGKPLMLIAGGVGAGQLPAIRDKAGVLRALGAINIRRYVNKVPTAERTLIVSHAPAIGTTAAAHDLFHCFFLQLFSRNAGFYVVQHCYHF
jgi:hypothetical protein